MRKRVPIEQRFWAKVQKSTGCWNWIGSCGGKGYGHISLMKRMYQCSRLSWELHFGSIPKGLFVLHKCDNGRCVRPDHLFLGTNKDNMQDCLRKGRLRPGHVPGEKHGQAKLSWKKVIKIRKMLLNGKKTQEELAKQFGVGATTISSVWRSVSWKEEFRPANG